MTMSDNEVQSPYSTPDNSTFVTENGFSYGQEVNKVKESSADGGGSMVDMTKNESSVSGTEVGAQLKPQQSSSSGKPKRSISFPQESCVSGYCDPPDPWKQAPKWTAQDVVTAYKKSCEKHGAKPLTKVVQQIEALMCNGKRAEKLVLKGEKVDMKQCETFEEILRRVQFKSLDLEACHLDDETAVALFDMIEFYESAQTLNISFNKNIGVRGWQACSRLIRRTPCLTTLDLRNCDMNDRSIPIFGRALKLGSHLTILHMENMYLSGRSLILLVAALKMNETLQELFLADNRLMPSDGIQLGNLLKYNHALTLLDLRNNHLQDVGVGHMCDGLYEQNLDKGLRTLVLWNNQVTFQAMASLSRALGSTKCLETLNLGHNNVTNEGIHILKEGLLKSKSLMRLGLQSTKLTCEGAVALAEYVADSLHLLRLDLRENDIKTAGLMALSLALKVNSTVTRIDLDKETKKESGMKDYADQQRRLQQEIASYLERNQQAVLQREEDERRQLEERAQVEMAARASVQSAISSAQLAIETHPEMMYAATSASEPQETVRPSLLFQAHRLTTPQESLESPLSSEMDLFCPQKGTPGDHPYPSTSTYNDIVAASTSTSAPTITSPPPLTLQLTNPLTVTQTVADGAGPSQGQGGSVDATTMSVSPNPSVSRLRSPPQELLLSPQYYPKPTARKIFSVSRVLEQTPSVASPTVSKTGVLDTGATGTSSTPAMKLQPTSGGGGGGVAGGGGLGPGSSVPSPISPTLLCQDLSAKTVNDYIQQIVAEEREEDPYLTHSSQVDCPQDSSLDSATNLLLLQNVPPPHLSAFSMVADDEDDDEKEKDVSGLDPLGVMAVASGSVSQDGVATIVSSPAQSSSGSGLSVRPSDSLEGFDIEPASFYTPTPEESPPTSSTAITPASNATKPGSISPAALSSALSGSVKAPSNKWMCSAVDPITPYSEEGKSCVPSKDTVGKKAGGSKGADVNKDAKLTPSPAVQEVLGTNCVPNSHIPQSSSPGPLSHHVASHDTEDNAPHTKPAQQNTKLAQQHNTAAYTKPVDTKPLGQAVASSAVCKGQPAKNEDFAAELDKLDREWGADNNDNNTAALQENRNTNFESTQTSSSTTNTESANASNTRNTSMDYQTSPRPSAPQSVLTDSSLFRTMEFPDFDINDDDLSLFGAASSSSSTTTSSSNNTTTNSSSSSSNKAKACSQTGDRGQGREVSPSLGDTWTTVDAACLGEGAGGEKEEDEEGEEEEEPDFFTSLSMNGLTQELANVLSSIDGKTDVDSQDLHTPDEFERELDAMLAVVKSDLPWPLQSDKTQSSAGSAAQKQHDNDDQSQSCA